MSAFDHPESSQPGILPVTGLVLAGGRARRMGGRDKGLLKLAGIPLMAHVLKRLQPQVDAVLISANRNLADYGAWGHPVLRDRFPDHAGPLAGIAEGLAATRAGWVMTVPCDVPLLPLDLVSRLRAEALRSGARVAVAHDGERLQPTIALIDSRLADDLLAHVAGGGRRVDEWLARQAKVTVDFSDCTEAFHNVNSPEDLQLLEQRLKGLPEESAPGVSRPLVESDTVRVASPASKAGGNG